MVEFKCGIEGDMMGFVSSPSQVEQTDTVSTVVDVSDISVIEHDSAGQMAEETRTVIDISDAVPPREFTIPWHRVSEFRANLVP